MFVKVFLSVTSSLLALVFTWGLAENVIEDANQVGKTISSIQERI